LPKEKSLVNPPSTCPSCDKRIKFYDNIPLLSWLALGRKCRYCKVPISPRYFIIELLTGTLFAVTHYLLFSTPLRAGIPLFITEFGWIIYLLIIILISGLVAGSAIDLELWVIPLSICWVLTIAGFIGCTVAPLLIDIKVIRGYQLLPYASAKTSALAVGASVGLGISLFLLVTGILKQSYAFENDKNAEEIDESKINHRLEMFREIVFIFPIIACCLGAYFLTTKIEPVRDFWIDFSQKPTVAGFLGSVFGYFIGCAIVWATRILGTLGFNKEAMGLGDVHLMGAVGAVLGPVPVIAAFFVAPFFGLAWALFQMFFKKSRQIPYGPFLSLGTFAVIILHNAIFDYFNLVLGNR
jgi:leader peptidase (prepilin peptidase)/N-methyltransferase